MSSKIASGINLFVGIVFLFGVVFAMLSLLEFFNIPIPSIVTPAQNLSILYCVQPSYILFSDLLGIEVGVIGEYLIYFFNFTFYTLLFVFSIALGVRQILKQRTKALTIFVQVLHIINIISALLVVILYLVIDYIEMIIFLPAIILFTVSLLAFIVNLYVQKRRMING